MRTPRRRFLITLLLVIVAGLCYHFDVYYHVKGWLRGDAYYEGMPTCYWADSLDEGHGRPEWLKSVYSFLGMKSSADIEFNEIFSGKPKTAGVLVQLLEDKNNSPRVWKRAIGV